MSAGAEDPQPLFRYSFGAAEFDEVRFELKVHGKAVDPQRKPLEVLALMLSAGGQAVSSDELRRRVWGGRPLVDNVVPNAVRKLRLALAPAGDDVIVSRKGAGYRIGVPVRRVVIGRRLRSALQLEPGMAVPHGEGLVLHGLVGRSRHAEVWRAQASMAGGASPRIVKFALDDDGLAALRREAGLAAALRAALGPRLDLADVLASQFEHDPCFIVRADAGTDLLRWAADGERLAAMTPTARLALFLQVCDAVAAAHRVNVVHRDLKPANVLVAPAPGGTWSVQVTDFGSGRLRPADGSVGAGAALGASLNAADLGSGDALTPAYIAPEVLRGAPGGAAADVFALGLLLMQTMAADFHLPLASGWERAIDDRLLREDIARATDADPARRFVDAGALAAALRTLPERREKAARDHAATLRASIQRSWAQLHEVEPAVAEGRRAVAAALLAPGPGSAEAVASQLQLAFDLARLSRFDESEALIGAVEAALAADPAPREAEHARLWWMRSDLLAHRLQLAESLHAAQRAVAHLQRAVEPPYALTDGVLARLGSALRMSGHYADSERIYRQLVTMREARDGPTGESTQRARVQLARALMLQWRTDEAMAIARDAAAHLAATLGEGNLITQQAHDCVASILFKRGEFVAAAETNRRVVAALSALSSAPTDFIATVQSNVGLALLQAGRPAEAEPELRRALEMALGLVAPDAPRAQSIRYQLAFARLDQGRIDGVAALLDGLDPVALKQANQADDWDGRIVFQQGRLAWLMGRREQALDLLRRAEPIVQRLAAKSGALVSPALVRRWIEAVERDGPVPPPLPSEI